MHRLFGGVFLLCVLVWGSPALAQGSINWGQFLGSEGANSLAELCAAAEASSHDFQCKMLTRMCEQTSGEQPLACKTLSNRAAFVQVEAVELPNPNALPAGVVEALEACKKDAACYTLAELETANKKAGSALKAWCAGRTLAGSSPEEWPSAAGRKLVGRVCEEIAAGRLGNVSLYELEMLKEEAGRTKLNCDGFGLVAPFFSFRRPGNGTVNVKALSGLGAGYYWAAPREWQGCQKDWTWGFDLFGYSEGIDLSKQEMHLGMGAGVGISASKYFKFGFGVGYDIYRQSADPAGSIQRNGLIAAKLLGTQSVSYLVTFSVSTGGGGGEEKK